MYLNSSKKTARKDLWENGKPRKNTYKRILNIWYDIIETSQSSIERCAHPANKIQKICDRIIQTHSNERDLTFVPFVESDSKIAFALNNDREVFGCEINKDYCLLVENRINKLSKGCHNDYSKRH